MIFITGANGWLGLNIISSIISGKANTWGLEDNQINAFILKGTSRKKLIEIAPNINIVEGDISNKEDLNKFLSNAANSIVFHTVGVIHPKKVSEFYKINRDGTRNLLESASNSSIRRVIIISSNSPCGCNMKTTELFDEGSPYNPYMNYGKSKMEMEQIANKFYERGLLDLVIIRAPWFYGPYQPDRQKLFFEMIRKGKGPIIGGGENIRSMVFTENLVQGMILAAYNKKASGKTYWIADKKPYTMNEIIDTVEHILLNRFNQKCNLGRLRLPGFISDFAEVTDSFMQKVGLYNQKIHVLSEMNKNIACAVDLAINELGYKPEFSLIDGMFISIDELYG